VFRDDKALVESTQCCQDWIRRGELKKQFIENPAEFRQFVAAVACEYIPRIRRFLTSNWSDRKKCLSAWKELVRVLSVVLKLVEDVNPNEHMDGFMFHVLVSVEVKDEAICKAFEEGKVTPSCENGNPALLGSIAIGLMFALISTYRGLTGLSDTDYRRSPMSKLSHEVGVLGLNGQFQDFPIVQNALLPLLQLVEEELSKFSAPSENRYHAIIKNLVVNSS
jgi:hypothetical protein